eukprot:TRINITY_DN557_c0_g1_i9.p2 TRINITY_DN557_c0_g1~~TRINITY_DN557_c0_g1_i9.p2  ORF type:complete len:108 (+),score=25.30 TRINITY_DN557_c0_g1_i9:74-397(+)
MPQVRSSRPKPPFRVPPKTGVSKVQQILPEESLETVKATVQGATESAKEMMSEGIQSESLESAKAAMETGVSKVHETQMLPEESLETGIQSESHRISEGNDERGTSK